MSSMPNPGAASHKWGGFRPNAIWKTTGVVVYVREVLGAGGRTQIIFEDGKEEWTHIDLCVFDPWLEEEV